MTELKADLHVACREGDTDSVRHLLAVDTDPNIKDENGDAPITLASERGFDDIVQMLIDKNADILVKDSKGKTALELADDKKHEKVILILEKQMIRLEGMKVEIEIGDTYMPTANMMIRRVYTFQDEEKGLALMINNKRAPGKPDRYGSDDDMSRMGSVFSQLGFRTETHENLSENEIKDVVAAAARKVDTDKQASMVVFCVSSYGESEFIECSDGGRVHMNQLMNNFSYLKCPYMNDKPKLFIMQIEQDPMLFRPFLLGNTSDTGLKVLDMLLVLYPVAYRGLGFPSNIRYGSWSTDNLVDVFQERAKDTDLADMLNIVSGRLIENNYDHTGRLINEIVNRGFLRRLFFNPGLKLQEPCLYHDSDSSS